MEKNNEMMQPLEDDELEEAAGGANNSNQYIYHCAQCNKSSALPGNCPKCGKALIKYYIWNS